MDRYFKNRIISKEIGHIHRYHIKSDLSYHTKAHSHKSCISYQCHATHHKSILPRLKSTLGCSSPGPDRALIAQALVKWTEVPRCAKQTYSHYGHRVSMISS
ncbi:hypothetical protein Taro_011980 [Colocasia esculenta]|uniref:Uncharacterized protein n=1 Tax=Colocasia esculenta TaxID=4460 RepID=A0A843UBN7_COLES|nr:hypothetical protein [Colocasia esculenta]